MRVQARIQKWGNSLALRLTGPVKDIPHFEDNMVVYIDANENGIQVRPALKAKRKKLRYTEAELLKGITSKLAHADELPTTLKKELGE